MYKVIVILSKYGYHGTLHLNAMMTDLDRQQANTEYIATILWSIGRIVGGESYPMPTYDDFIHPKPSDHRGTEQIINGLINKLGKGGG